MNTENAIADRIRAFGAAAADLADTINSQMIAADAQAALARMIAQGGEIEVALVIGHPGPRVRLVTVYEDDRKTVVEFSSPYKAN